MCQTIHVNYLCEHGPTPGWHLACSQQMDERGPTWSDPEDALRCPDWTESQWDSDFRCFPCYEKEWLMWKDRRDWVDGEEREEREDAATDWDDFEREQTLNRREELRLRLYRRKVEVERRRLLGLEENKEKDCGDEYGSDEDEALGRAEVDDVSRPDSAWKVRRYAFLDADRPKKRIRKTVSW
ncbi:hypothetical protein EJ08DRAFT_700846 [Tothia fuscella]|uniref:Uncharacterized protein n=1 Tax=Tothia fuscella TaxID=1048955 RepID=A0A9P4TV61_9PEZI|nr:hypothetical protein EJ08DRAFT_700846 [Tothia fuscella]